MSDFRSRVIRLAHAKPELRPALLPLLKEAAAPGDAAYMKALDNLADLAELTENAQEIIDGFNLHYASGRVAAMDPRIVSEKQILTKVTEGQKLADQTVKSMENFVKLYPNEKKYAKALADARKTLDKLTKQLEASKNIIRTVSKKVAPKALTEFSKKLEAKVKSKLIDPSQIDTFFTQSVDSQGNVGSFFAVNALVSGTEIRPTIIWIKELVTGAPGLSMSVNVDGHNLYGGWAPATVDGAVEKFLEAVRGWKNVKGEAESQSARSGTAQAIANALNKNLTDSAKPSPDFLRVEGDYRGDLPKEGAEEVGEYRYEEMVREEISYARKRVDSALAPYKSQIANVSIQPEEKGWVYITVTLK